MVQHLFAPLIGWLVWNARAAGPSLAPAAPVMLSNFALDYLRITFCIDVVERNGFCSKRSQPTGLDSGKLKRVQSGTNILQRST